MKATHVDLFSLAHPTPYQINFN